MCRSVMQKKRSVDSRQCWTGSDENICKMGIFARNIKILVLEDIQVMGQDGEAILMDGIDSLEWTK